jgi:3-methylcrotonyl-CoA carboxylase alpha subunit
VFGKILIANRGEIAVRVIRTAHRMGVRTLAVYSDADAGALHVRLADQAVRIGPPEAAESYLRGDAIVEAARRTGAEAIHPGYGFLAENADFAAACERAGITFIGPPVESIRAMGSKSAARALMEEAGVPIVPGVSGMDAELRDGAVAIGFPVLVKPALGGGGKGMRRVAVLAELDDALASARREAMAAFGDGELIVEKYVERARHIEVQIVADARGDIVHLFDRDCSPQRRHQKIVEEAPAPGLSDGLRERMAAAAIAAARAVGYVNAGTVEFIVPPSPHGEEDFYFLEMNTRLQVEHPVSEMITGIDLVEWQLRIAAGEPLPMKQGEIRASGHAIEARIYAEAPERDFLPSAGRVHRFRPPDMGAGLRLDSGVAEGDRVPPYYDPMIAKLVALGGDRAEALARLRGALGAFEVAGVATNIAFLLVLTGHPAFAAAAFDTGAIDREAAEYVPGGRRAGKDAVVAAALHVVGCRRSDAARASPWGAANGWRLNGPAEDHLEFGDGGVTFNVVVSHLSDRVRVSVDGKAIDATMLVTAPSRVSATVDGHAMEAIVFVEGAVRTVIAAETAARLVLVDPLAVDAVAEIGGGVIASPMPGKITRVMAGPGAHVRKGEPLFVVEAMKMEHTVSAPADGSVIACHFTVGDFVEEGTALAEFEADAA